jgi:nitrogen fixation protein NifU and related proteins
VSPLERQAAIELVLERYERPTHRGALPPPASAASATNPRCGDTVTMYVALDAAGLARVAFDGSGCTISQAAADVAAELADGGPPVAGLAIDEAAVLRALGDAPVRTRLECVRVSTRALRRALAEAMGGATRSGGEGSAPGEGDRPARSDGAG